MINGLAAWHYPHRTTVENVEFFAKNGFFAISILGGHMDSICRDITLSAELAKTVKNNNVILTVHHILPRSHSADDVAIFKDSVDVIAAWQKKYGLINVLSFDVPQNIRDNITPYVEYVLSYDKFLKVAVEDFGLNSAEKLQLELFKGNKRFGYLVDIGHLYIRIRGKNNGQVDIFKNQPQECLQTDTPGYTDFVKAIKSKEFPIFEIHIHNNDGVDDLHYFLNDGTLDIPMIAKVLKNVEYDGILTIESDPGFKFECKYPESDKRILETLKYWEKLI